MPPPMETLFRRLASPVPTQMWSGFLESIAISPIEIAAGPIEDGLPGSSRVDGLEQAARSGRGVHNARISGHAFDTGNAPAHRGRTDAAPLERVEGRRIDALRGGGSGKKAEENRSHRGVSPGWKTSYFTAGPDVLRAIVEDAGRR